MQNFGNYNVNPNTPIYVGGEKKKVKKQNEDKSLGEKVAIGVASTAGAIAAILIGYGIINKFTGNTTKITKDAKKAAEAVVPKAKDAGKKLLPPNNTNVQDARTILKNFNKIREGSLTYDQALKMQESLQALCTNGIVENVTLNGINLAQFFNHLLIYLSTITKNGKDNFKCDTSNKELLCNEGANFWTRIEKIDNINKYLGNFQLTDVEVDDKEAKLSLKKNSTTKETGNLKVAQTQDTSNLIELCNGLYIVEGSINDASKLYIKNKEGKFAEITLGKLKEDLNPVVTIEHPIENLNDIKQFDTLVIVNGQKDGTTELYLTGLKKEREEKIFSIKVSTLVADSELLTKLIQLKNITPDIFAEVIKTADASILYQLMNDAGLKDKLVESNELTDVGKKIVDAAIKDKGAVDSGKIITMLNRFTDLTEGSVGAAVVDYLLADNDVNGMLNQLMNDEKLKDQLVKDKILTEVGKKIVDAAIRDKGVIASGKIVTMLSEIEDLDTKGSVGAAVVEHLLANTDITEDLLNQLMSNTNLKSKFIGQTGDDKNKLTEVGQKFMKKAIDKHISLKALNGLVKRFGIKDFSYTISNKNIALTINANSQLLITNYAQYVYDYIKTCGDANSTEVVADVDRLLFRSILKEDAYNKYFDGNGKFKDINSVSFAQEDFKTEYTTTQHQYEDFESVKYLKQVASNWATCLDQVALALAGPTTLGQVLASQDIQAKLTTGNPQKLTEAGKAIVEAAIVYNVQPLSGSKQPSRENIVELLSNLGSFDENTVGAAVVDHLLGLDDVTAEMLGQALNNDKLKAKFFNEPTSEGTTTYSLTPAGQHMIKQAAMTYDHDLFVKFVKSLDTENYIECIYETVASMKDDENNTRFQAYWLIAALIQDNSTEKTLKNKLHTIIQDNKGQHFNFSDLNCDDFTEDSQITEDGKLALILFANSKSSDFIGAAKEDTSLGFTSSTITINSFKFRYKIDGTNHTVYYSKK